MTSKEALINLKLDVSVKGKLSKFQQICFECLEKELENHTLSECIKEWEEEGWEVYVSNREIELLETNSLNTISIDKRDKCYWCNYYLSFELHHLLSKTLKALEEMK